MEDLIRDLYQVFEHNFRNGDIVVTGSYLYAKMGLIAPKDEYNDLDLSVITGVEGDELVIQIQNYFLGQGGRTKIIKEPNQRTFVVTSDMSIDIFREDFTKYSGVDYEIISGVWMKNYGIEKVIDGANIQIQLLLDKYGDNLEGVLGQALEKARNTLEEIQLRLDNKIKK